MNKDAQLEIRVMTLQGVCAEYIADALGLQDYEAQDYIDELIETDEEVAASIGP